MAARVDGCVWLAAALLVATVEARADGLAFREDGYPVAPHVVLTLDEEQRAVVRAAPEVDDGMGLRGLRALDLMLTRPQRARIREAGGKDAKWLRVRSDALVRGACTCGGPANLAVLYGDDRVAVLLDELNPAALGPEDRRLLRALYAAPDPEWNEDESGWKCGPRGARTFEQAALSSLLQAAVRAAAPDEVEPFESTGVLRQAALFADARREDSLALGEGEWMLATLPVGKVPAPPSLLRLLAETTFVDPAAAREDGAVRDLRWPSAALLREGRSTTVVFASVLPDWDPQYGRWTIARHENGRFVGALDLPLDREGADLFLAGAAVPLEGRAVLFVQLWRDGERVQAGVSRCEPR